MLKLRLSEAVLKERGLDDVADRLPPNTDVDAAGRIGVRRGRYVVPSLFSAREVLLRLAPTPPSPRRPRLAAAATSSGAPQLELRTVTQTEIAFDGWLWPEPEARRALVRLPLADRAKTPWIGPDPAQPCTGCQRRARCRDACEALEQVVGVAAEYRSDPHHVSSEAVMMGLGYDPQFMTIPDELRIEDGEPLWPKLVAIYGGDRLRAAMKGPKPITPQQQMCIEMALQGHDRKRIAVEYLKLMARIGRHDAKATARGHVTRQTICKVTSTGLKVLRANLGPAPSREYLAGIDEPDE